MYDTAGSTALVTGASSGIGAEIARLLAGRGVAALVLVARSEDKLEALARELCAGHGDLRVEIIPADLSQPDAARRIHAETERRGLIVDLLVNNAGFGSHGFFDERDGAREAEMIAVNVHALVALTSEFLPGMVARGRGGILNVASTAAFQPVPYMATYGATKAFVLSFSEALWAENRDRGVRVVCLCPGKTETNFAAESERSGSRFEEWEDSTAEEVARAGLDALERNASFVVVGRSNYIGTLSARIAPRAVMARSTANIFRPESAQKNSAVAPLRFRKGAAALGLLAGAVLLGYAKRRRKN